VIAPGRIFTEGRRGNTNEGGKALRTIKAGAKARRMRGYATNSSFAGLNLLARKSSGDRIKQA
jgi:hypothetical protein